MGVNYRLKCCSAIFNLHGYNRDNQSVSSSQTGLRTIDAHAAMQRPWAVLHATIAAGTANPPEGLAWFEKR